MFSLPIANLCLLLIEDDPMIGQSLVRALGDEGIRADWERDGIQGDRAWQSGKYTLVLLDLGLPNRCGLRILQQQRQAGNRTPVIILTARDEVDDRVAGLESGADDYVVKPFGLAELMARIHAVLRRSGLADGRYLSNGEISLNRETREVRYRNVSQSLPPREFELLDTLLNHPGRIFSREQLEQRLYQSQRDLSRHAIDVLIHSLRKKFDDEIVRNVRGVGWMVLKYSET